MNDLEASRSIWIPSSANDVVDQGEPLGPPVQLATTDPENSEPLAEDVLDMNRRLETLSKREREVMTGVVAGDSNKRIGFYLGISSRTVEIYRANLMTKMKARSLPELVRFVLKAKRHLH